MTLPHLKRHPILRSYSHATIQLCHISLTTTPMAPKLSRMSNWLRGRHAQSEITLLFCAHVTKTLYLHFHMVHGPWLWMIGHHLKNLQRDAFTTWQIENVVFFLVQSNLNWFFTLIFCISPVHKPTRLWAPAFRILIFLQVFGGLIKHF